MPLLHSGPLRHQLWNAPLVGLFCATFFLDAVTSFRSPQFPRVQDFLKTFLLSDATVARRDAFLQAVASFFRDQ
jgi:hypothetical protein